MGLVRSLTRLARDVLRTAVREAGRKADGHDSDRDRAPRRPSPTPRPKPAPRDRAPALGSDYPGDFTGIPELEYSPRADRAADPGEIVWTWVPFEEDVTQGKDRPVLIIGRDGQWLLGLGLSSRDHDADAHQEARNGRFWVDIGTGNWDQQGRPSEVRVNRVIRVHPERIRRIAARLDEDRFRIVVVAVRKHARER